MDEIKYNEIVSFFLALQLALITMKNILISNIRVVNSYNGILNAAIIGIVIFGYIIVVFKSFFKIKFSEYSVIILVLIILFWIVSFLFNAASIIQYGVLEKDLISFMAYSVLPMLLIPTMERPGQILDWFYKWVYFCAALTTLSFAFFFLNGKISIVDNLNYNMTFGKNAVLISILLLSKYKKDQKKVDLLLGLVLVIQILLISSRFPLLYAAAYVFIMLCQSLKNGKNRFLKLLATIICLIVFFMLYSNLASLIIELLDRLKINARSVKLLLDGSFFSNTSGRDEIHDYLITALHAHPLGMGAGGSEILLNGEYAHGFVFDLFGNMGIFLGMFFIIISFSMILGSFFWIKDTTDKELYIVLFCCFFPTITAQDGMWTAYRFWWLLAIAIYAAKRKNYYLLYIEA